MKKSRKAYIGGVDVNGWRIGEDGCARRVDGDFEWSVRYVCRPDLGAEPGAGGEDQGGAGGDRGIISGIGEQDAGERAVVEYFEFIGSVPVCAGGVSERGGVGGGRGGVTGASGEGGEFRA